MAKAKAAVMGQAAPAPVLTQAFVLTGGLDQVSPTLTLDPGKVRDGLNFECATTGGYTRIMGYERFSGRPAPSEQSYWTLAGTTFNVLVGQTIVGKQSGATGVVAYIDMLSVIGTTFLAITKLTGTFALNGETVTVGGLSVGVIEAREARASAPTPQMDVEYQKAAGDIYRLDIVPVPGSGPILGVWMYNNVVYAFRNNPAGTAALMYKSTGTGWVLVTTPALLPGGRYEFVTANFGGTTAMSKMFGCDSVNKAFQFDGTTFTQITTGMTIDKPNHIEYHKNFLFLAFSASLQFSAVGDPLTWSAVVGAGEIALGDNITSIKSYIGNNSYIGTESTNALLIHTNSMTEVLYGSSIADFSLSKHSSTAGAIAGSVQIIDQPYYMSDLGIVNMQVTQAYGNFLTTALSQTINPFILQEKTRVTASCIVRGKSQYRIFFNDDYCLYVTFLNGKVLGMMICNLSIPIRCVASLKLSDNSEVIFAGSDSGYVYQLEKGPNFDGQTILAYLNLAFAAFKSPRVLKRFRKVVLEVRGTGYLEYSVSADLSWANTDIAITRPFVESAQLNGTPWDTFDWDQFFWDGVNNAPTETPLDGTGENIGLRILSEGDSFPSFTVASAIFHYSMRRQLR